jgi:hypothetical protein
MIPSQDITADRSAIARLIVRAAVASARRPVAIIVAALVAMVACGWYVAGHFAMNTDSAKLISAEVDWRKRSAAFDAAFPQHTDLIAIVIDGTTPDVAERAAATLALKLSTHTDLFHTVRRPDAGPYFAKNGLMLLDTSEVQKTTEQLVSSQAVIGQLAADPSVRGLVDTLKLALEGVRRKDTTLDVLGPGLSELAKTTEGASAGKLVPLNWRAMLGGGTPRPQELRKFVLAQPMLDYSALKPGEKASDFIRQAARDAGLDEAHGVRVRLTGGIPMADEEFGTLEENAVRNAVVMLGALLLMLWGAVRSIRAVVAIFVTLVAGLALTGAIGLAIYHALNLISVAFAVLFIGLGVDFGIQYAVAYRANASEGSEPVAGAARQVGTAPRASSRSSRPTIAACPNSVSSPASGC